MANFALSFLQGAEHLGEGLVQGVVNPVAKFGNELGAVGQAETGNLEGAQRTLNPGGGLLHQGGVLQGREAGTPQNPAAFIGPNAAQNIRATASEGLQLGSLLAGPAVGAAAATPGAGYGLNFLRGAVANAAFGTASSAGQQLLDTGKIDTKQLGQGALISGALGGLGGVVSQFRFLNKLAKSDDVNAIVNQLKEHTGEPVAREIAPAIAKTNDPNVVKNVIFNAIGNKLTSLNEVGAVGGDLNAGATPSPTPPGAPEVPPTTVNDVAPPAGQGSLATENIDPLANLKQEALKYKSADEFINSQKPVYHGTNADLTDFSQLQSGRQRGEYSSGSRSIFASENPELANKYGENVLEGRNIGKVLDTTKLGDPHDPNNMVVPKEFADYKTSPLLDATDKRVLENSYFKGGTPSNIIIDHKPNIQEYFRSKGYSAIQIPRSSDVAGPATEMTIIDPSKITTKQQLTDLYNQAHAEGKNVPLQPLGQGSEQNAKPLFNAPETENPQPTRISQLAAHQTAADVLNQGGTVDEAMNELMVKGGLKYGDAKTSISNLIQQPGQILDKSKVNAKLNPQYDNVSFPEASPGNSERATLNAQTAYKEVGRRANDAIAAMKELSPDDLKLVDQLRSNNPKDIIAQAQDKEQFTNVVKSLKEYNDYTQASGASLGQDVPYRQNYGVRPQYDRSTPEAETNFQNAQANLATQPGYSKGAFFKNYDEAASLGVNRLNQNAIQDLAMDASQRASHQSQLALYKALDEAYPGQVSVENLLPPGNHQILIPGGEKLSMPSALADKINERAPAPDAHGFWAGFDNLNAETKNLKLGGGTFHGVTTAGTFVGQQLTSGQFYKDPGAVGSLIKNTFSSNAFKSYQSDLAESGHLRAFDQFGLTRGQAEVAADVEPSGKVANIPVLKQLHQVVFGREIPFMKMRSMEQWMADNKVDPNNITPEQLQEGTKYAKGLNKSYGGLNQAIQGLTPKQFQLASRAFLSADYTSGQLMTLRDAFTKGGPEGKLARQVVFGKALLFGGLATAGAVAGGEFKDQTPQQVAIDILHKFVNPSFTMGGYKVGLPATPISLVGKPVEQTVTGAQNGHPLSGVQNFANARLAAVPSEALQLAGNKNYQGQPIYGKDTRGRPISHGTTASDIASTVLPIPAANTVKTATGSESIPAAIANTAGLNVTPQYSAANASTAAQTYLQQLDAGNAPKAQIDAATKFASLLSQGAKTKSKVLTEAETDIGKGDQQSAQAVIDKYNQQLFQKLKPWVSKQNIAYVDNSMLQILQSAMINFGTANKYAAKDIKKNPTKYGQPITPLSNNLPVGPVGPQTILAQ